VAEADDVQEFLKAHWNVLAAVDFFAVEVWTATGLTRYVVLSVIELATRRVRIAGIASELDNAWVVQCSRQLTDAVDGFLVGKRFLLHDRDPLFAAAFRETLATTGVETAHLPPCSESECAHGAVWADRKGSLFESDDHRWRAFATTSDRRVRSRIITMS
jgi:hypothetical protein